MLEPDSGKASSSSQSKKSANFSHEDTYRDSEHESAPDKQEGNEENAEGKAADDDKKEEVKESPQPKLSLQNSKESEELLLEESGECSMEENELDSNKSLE